MRALSLPESSLYPSARVRFCARAKEIRARAGRFALAHYINLLSRYKNALLTFGSKITPYIIRFLTESVTFLFVGIWYNHDAMYLNKMSRTSSRNGPTTLKIQQYRRGLAIGSTGTFPGGLAADLARCPVLYFYFLFFIYLFLFFAFQCAKVIISDCGIP